MALALSLPELSIYVPIVASMVVMAIVIAAAVALIELFLGRKQRTSLTASKLKMAEDALRASEERFTFAEHARESSQLLYLSLVENLPVYLMRKDLAGRFTFANQAFCRLLDRSLGDPRHH